MSVSMEEDYNESMGETKMALSSTATTIDPSVIQSRIRQSASLQSQDDTMMADDSQQPIFPKLSAAQAAGNKVEYRRVRCPAHRYTPLREHWEQILTPLVEYLNLQVRICCLEMNFELCAKSCYGGTIVVVFLETSVLQNASMNQGKKWDD
eukprot:scaffold15472_cov117-Cylindrotheca_fusiformis.AAC.25